MTIHKAKGLEFPVVCLTGMIEGLMPHKNGDIEEERRIAFVGASRAMKLLYLSYSFNYTGRAVKKSLFLDEMMGKMLKLGKIIYNNQKTNRAGVY